VCALLQACPASKRTVNSDLEGVLLSDAWRLKERSKYVAVVQIVCTS
jgi:hypothetical protein